MTGGCRYFQAERGRRQAELDLGDAREQANEASSQLASATAVKRKLESELQALHVSHLCAVVGSCLGAIEAMRLLPVGVGRMSERAEELR